MANSEIKFVFDLSVHERANNFMIVQSPFDGVEPE